MSLILLFLFLPISPWMILLVVPSLLKPQKSMLPGMCMDLLQRSCISYLRHLQLRLGAWIAPLNEMKPKLKKRYTFPQKFSIFYHRHPSSLTYFQRLKYHWFFSAMISIDYNLFYNPLNQSLLHHGHFAYHPKNSKCCYHALLASLKYQPHGRELLSFHRDLFYLMSSRLSPMLYRQLDSFQHFHSLNFPPLKSFLKHFQVPHSQ
mmetsp:Transcript_31989/g.36961  ORF Transcript_31989/g.36961 Transcript_31989/m.36961 type:complete len:205 (-) Transcript_31989:749-1363(-)